MSTPDQPGVQVAAAPPPAPAPGFLERTLGKLEGRAAPVIEGIVSDLAAHRQVILDVGTDAVALLKLIDPADAALVAAAEALVPRILDVASEAGKIAGAVRSHAAAQ